VNPVKPIFRPMSEFPSMEARVERLTLRYKAAFDEYQGIVDKNAEACFTGGKPSEQSLLEEERAFEELDSARHALLEAAAHACPTIH
jgi:hypothetical protein